MPWKNELPMEQKQRFINLVVLQMGQMTGKPFAASLFGRFELLKRI
jgi:hypothetical protein